ncbi:MAG: DUF2779 domain-containing protein [Acidobacteriota bacterium]
MKTPRLLTKSRFKLATVCPTKLYYTGKPDIYPDRSVDDPFLLALSTGGFQVGELAKSYFPGGVEIGSKPGDHVEAVAATDRELQKENAVIFEAAVRHEGFFIRIDILVKSGDRLEVIEVKSKSYEEGVSAFFGARGGISSEWKEYLYDVAFQKMVVQAAFPQADVSSYLMLADKAAVCPSNGLNQKFRVRTRENGRKYVELASALDEDELNDWILEKVPVDEACERIFAGTEMGDESSGPLHLRAAEYARIYERDERVTIPISRTCKSCEFRATEEEEKAGKISGFKQCWTASLNWTAADFSTPPIFDVWNLNYQRADKLISDGRLKISDITISDLTIKEAERGLSQSQRQWLQIEKAQNGDPSPFIDKDGLRREMAGWKFPLHFIDFETATAAIPFNRGRRPYEEIAFQYSHHLVREDGTVEHASEYLDDRIGVFPNYDFLRALKCDLSADDGTIFRYAPHENTYLVKIYDQLMRDAEDITDRDELCSFIRSITTRTTNGDANLSWNPPRAMVDMCELVKLYFYHPHTCGSNSIKKVLPAVLRSSDFLRDKYSRPTYGTEIKSRNFNGGQCWFIVEGDEIKDPYECLPPIFGCDIIDRLSDETDLKDGGGAMMAYARLQFEDMSADERREICDALKRYCELDTLAMVMIYEAWREMV